MPKYTVQKAYIERYYFRFENGNWAQIYIDSEHNTLMCQSTFGDYGYPYWHPAKTETFKDFLIGMENEKQYLLEKVAKKEFDLDLTVQNWKAQIIEWRRSENCTKNQAREMWDVINDLADSGANASELYHNLEDYPTFREVCSDWWDGAIASDYTIDAYAFADIVFPALVEVLKKEKEWKY